MEQFIESWGYWAVFIGTTIEGEFVYMSGMIASELSHLTIFGVMSIAFLGAITRDGLIFAVSRYGSKDRMGSNLDLHKKMDKVSTWLEKKPSYFLIFYRFFYGISTLIVLTLALSKISVLRYSIICLLGSTLWASAYGFLGYFAAHEIIRNLEVIDKYKWWIALVLLVVGLISYLFKRIRRSKN